MWMLIRANALGAEVSSASGARILAACPDTAERGDPWRWTAELDESAAEPVVSLEADPDYIAARTQQFSGSHTGLLQRAAGEQLIVASLAGEALVAAESGPWERWLRPGDVFIVEGEDPEAIRLSLAGSRARAQTILLTPRKAKVLRWVP